MPPVLVKNGDSLEVDLSKCRRGAEFEEARERLQEMPTRRFDWDRKLWILPAEPDVAERLVKGVGCKTSQDVLDWMSGAVRAQADDLATKLPDDVSGLLIEWAYRRAPWQPESVNDTKVVGLTNYQRVAVDHMIRHRKVLLGDEMGLGKTLIALSTVEEYKLRNGIQAGPVLIIAPASVKGSWLREIKRWLPEGTPVVVVDGKTPAKRHEQLSSGIEQNAYVICNWEQLRVKKEKRKRTIRRKDGSTAERTDTVTVPKEPLFSTTEWLAVVADEVHRAKNRDAQQTQGLWLLKGQLMLGLTGTAVQNSPDELWSILAWLFPDDYHERGNAHRPGALAYWPFYMTFCDHYELYGRKMVVGVKNADQLRFRLKDRMVRRTAAVLGLKGRKRFFYPVELLPYQRKLYDEATEKMWLQVQADAAAGDKTAQNVVQAILSGGNVLQIPNGAARMVRQRQILETPALIGGEDKSAILDDLEDKFGDSKPDQWIFFCAFKGTCEIFRERLEKKFKINVGVYTGDVAPEDRTKLEDDFQVGRIDAMIGTIDAMREGITLTAAHEMGFVSRALVPAWNEQAEAREDRMGQQERVNVWIPQGLDTIADGTVQIINDRKEKIVKNIQPMDKIEEDGR